MSTCDQCNALTQRIQQLEAQLAALQTSNTPVASTSQLPPAPIKPFDFSRYRKRKIALKFTYEGWHYGGLAIQNTVTPLPTVEEKLVDALVQARLVESRELEAMGFARCGRTDRGVSAAGQVVSLWVRSNLSADRLPPDLPPTGEEGEETYMERIAPPAPGKDTTDGEMQYDHLLNRLLPRSIRILAWSPVDARFDARFSCSGRHYKYFFTSSPSHAPLNIAAMQEAARLLVGEHDFRNLCKLDGAKQITNYRRRIDSATISLLPSSTEYYVFDLQGTAFLWHQVRHIVAILFHVGAALEPLSIVSSFLDIDAVPSKPAYEMASDLPLMLWDCLFPEESVSWQTSGRGEVTRRGMAWQAEELHVKALLAGHQLAALDGLVAPSRPREPMLPKGAGEVATATRAKYRPLLKRERGLHFEEVNRRWQEGRGARRAEKSDEKVSNMHSV